MIAESSPAAGAGVAQAEALEVATDLFIGSDTAARLVLPGSESVSAERLELVAERLGSIVGLACLCPALPAEWGAGGQCVAAAGHCHRRRRALRG